MQTAGHLDAPHGPATCAAEAKNQAKKWAAGGQFFGGNAKKWKKTGARGGGRLNLGRGEETRTNSRERSGRIPGQKRGGAAARARLDDSRRSTLEPVDQTGPKRRCKAAVSPGPRPGSSFCLQGCRCSEQASAPGCASKARDGVRYVC